MANNEISLSEFRSKKRKVKSSWIDYNGHMNVTYYTLAFDEAIDEFLDTDLELNLSSTEHGLNQGSYALQTQYRYLNELLLNDDFYITIFVADFTEKRMHLMLQMYEASGNTLCATCETVMVNVDLERRRSCTYSKPIFERLSELYERSEQLRLSTVIGHPIGLKKKQQR